MKDQMNVTSAFQALIQACADVHDARPNAEALGIVQGWMNQNEAIGAVLAFTLVDKFEPVFSPQIMASVLINYCDRELAGAFIDFYEQLSSDADAAKSNEMWAQQFDAVMNIAEFAFGGKSVGWKMHWAPFKQPYLNQWRNAFG